MGRLLNPGLGELVDRRTILELKCARAPLDSDPSHFHQELAQVVMLLDRTAALTEPIRQQIVALRAVNTELWDCEDQMAAHAQAFDQTDISQVVTCAALGVHIWHMNRERNRLIYELNRLAGNARGPEKL